MFTAWLSRGASGLRGAVGSRAGGPGSRWLSSEVEASTKNGAPRRGIRRLAVVGLVVGGYTGYTYAWREGWFNFTPEKQVKQKLVVLGSGWASVALTRHVDPKLYDIYCVSPRNYFLMTPLLPSVSVGTVETRTVCEPVRPLLGNQVNFLEAECIDVDPLAKKIVCQSAPAQEGKQKQESQLSKRDVADNIGGSSSRSINDGARTRPPFEMDYDVLVVAVGAENNTFNTPGVNEHAHFLKELPDARRVRAAISDCFESAAIPSQTEEEIERLLTFVVVGGGPTGVEFAAELSDMVQDDLRKNFPNLKGRQVKITLVEALDHILSMYDAKISDFTEKHFTREKIDVLNKTFVKEVKQKAVVFQKRGSSELQTMPCGMVVWATGIKSRPIVQKLRARIGEAQSNPRAVLTDPSLKVQGTNGIYAMGDCSSIQMPRVSDYIAGILPEDSAMSFEEFEEFLAANKKEYPQLDSYAAQVRDSFEAADVNKDGKLQRDELLTMLNEADKSLRPLPATAQVANQEGRYLANTLNKAARENRAIESLDPFQYRHMGSLAYVGGEQAVIDFTGVGSILRWFGVEPISGRGAFYLWRSFYLSEMVTMRTKFLLAFDWLRSKVFGRDISRV